MTSFSSAKVVASEERGMQVEDVGARGGTSLNVHESAKDEEAPEGAAIVKVIEHPHDDENLDGSVSEISSEQESFDDPFYGAMGGGNHDATEDWVSIQGSAHVGSHLSVGSSNISAADVMLGGRAGAGAGAGDSHHSGHRRSSPPRRLSNRSSHREYLDQRLTSGAQERTPVDRRGSGHDAPSSHRAAARQQDDARGGNSRRQYYQSSDWIRFTPRPRAPHGNVDPSTYYRGFDRKRVLLNRSSSFNQHHTVVRHGLLDDGGRGHVTPGEYQQYFTSHLRHQRHVQTSGLFSVGEHTDRTMEATAATTARPPSSRLDDDDDEEEETGQLHDKRVESPSSTSSHSEKDDRDQGPPEVIVVSDQEDANLDSSANILDGSAMELDATLHHGHRSNKPLAPPPGGGDEDDPRLSSILHKEAALSATLLDDDDDHEDPNIVNLKKNRAASKASASPTATASSEVPPPDPQSSSHDIVAASGDDGDDQHCRDEAITAGAGGDDEQSSQSSAHNHNDDGDMVNIDQAIDLHAASWDSKFESYSCRVDRTQNDRSIEITLCSMSRPHMRAFHFSWISFFVAFLSWFSITPLLSEVQDTLGLTREQIWTSSICSVAGAVVFRCAAGLMCDIYGARLIMGAILFICGVPTMFTGLVQDTLGLSLLRLVIGIGGSAFVTCQYWTTIMFSREVAGTANALAAGWGNLGGGVTQVLMGSVLFPLFKWIFESSGTDTDPAELSWRVICIIPGLISTLFAFVVIRYSDDSPKGNYHKRRRTGLMADTSVKESFAAAVSDLNTWILFVQYGCCFGVELTTSNAAALYFKEEFGQSTESAAAIASVFGWMNLFARGLGGYCSDMSNAYGGMKGRMKWQIVSFALQGITVVIFSEARTLAGAILAMTTFSIFVQASEGSTFGIVPYLNPDLTGAVAGVVGAGGNLGAVAFSLVFRQVSYRRAFFIMGLTVLCSAFLSVLLSIPGYSGILFGRHVVEYGTEPSSSQKPTSDGPSKTTVITNDNTCNDHTCPTNCTKGAIQQ